jgi:hypothetical protein
MKDGKEIYNSIDNEYFAELNDAENYINHEISYSLRRIIGIRKPIMCDVDIDNGFVYKYIRIGYATGIPIKFRTDLKNKDWIRMLDKGLTQKEIETFEIYGHF